MWGVAYEIAAEEVQWVKEHLDHRERGGYEAEPVLFTPVSEDHKPFNVDIYIGSINNPFFLGENFQVTIKLESTLSTTSMFFLIFFHITTLFPHSTSLIHQDQQRRMKWHCKSLGARVKVAPMQTTSSSWPQP